MKTEKIQYQNVHPGDKLFTNGADNHMFRKLKFLEVETVQKIESYESRGAGRLCAVYFESGNSTLGIFDRILEKVLE